MVCPSGFHSPARQTRKGFEKAMVLTGDSYHNRPGNATLGRGVRLGRVGWSVDTSQLGRCVGVETRRHLLPVPLLLRLVLELDNSVSHYQSSASPHSEGHPAPSNLVVSSIAGALQASRIPGEITPELNMNPGLTTTYRAPFPRLCRP